LTHGFASCPNSFFFYSYFKSPFFHVYLILKSCFLFRATEMKFRCWWLTGSH
jgi:hypothetical protein